MKKLFLLFAMAMAFASCTAKLTEEVVETYPDGKAQRTQFLNRKGTCVKEVEFYETGQVKMEGGMKCPRNPSEIKGNQVVQKDGGVWSMRII